MISKYKEELKHDLIDGEWITKEDIENHTFTKKEKQLLDAPEGAIQEESLKGE